MNVRKAAVAGLFYEADRQRLQHQVDSLIGATAATIGAPDHKPPKVLIVPHAGYIYSGRTAAGAYCRLLLRRQEITRVVLLGPAHRVYLRGMAVPSVDAFATPLGEVVLDRDSIDRISILPGVSVEDEAHRNEHSLEVQLPFLQSVLAEFSLVPVVVGYCDPDTVARVVDALWGGPETLVIVSTDLSHFHDYQEADMLDSLTCDRLLGRASDLSGEEACGAHALNGLMRSEHCRRLAIELLDRCNSGDSVGPRDKVVGYGAFALH
jgi:MEMO1 family protein